MGPAMVEAKNMDSWNLRNWRLEQGNMGPWNMHPDGMQSHILERRRLVPGYPWTWQPQQYCCAGQSTFSLRLLGPWPHPPGDTDDLHHTPGCSSAEHPLQRSRKTVG
jgi:hypothetical protein